MRYIGNKNKLLPFIDAFLDDMGIERGRALDAFAGTATVGRYLKSRGMDGFPGLAIATSTAACIADREGHRSRPRSVRRAGDHRDRASGTRGRGSRRKHQTAADAALPAIVGPDYDVAA